tara:strand:- start:234 stop:437 length:204 start_codon:yes stop_codon:yes gene_type:complete
MNKIDPYLLRYRFDVSFFPQETLIGLKIVNCEVLCEDDKYRPVYGLEIGFIFFTISYININLDSIED